MHNTDLDEPLDCGFTCCPLALKSMCKRFMAVSTWVNEGVFTSLKGEGIFVPFSDSHRPSKVFVNHLQGESI